jgi:hypothetical protein
MTPVTDPAIVAQLEGSGGQSLGAPVTDPAIISQLEGGNAPAQTNPSPLFNVTGHLAAGLANSGQGLHNFIASGLTPILGKYAPAQTNIDFDKTFGVNNTGLGNQLLEGAAQYAPYAIGGELAALPKVLEGIPALSKVPAVGNWLNRIVTSNINQAPTAAIFGMTQNADPIKGADESVAANTIGIPLHMTGSAITKGVGALAGTKNAINSIGNAILNRLNKASAQGAALSPQDTAENLAANYTGTNGQPLNVDIGTVANNPALKGVYQGLKYVPFTGVSKNTNILNRQLSDKAIDDTQDNLNQAYANNALSQTNARAENSNTAQSLFGQLNDLSQQQQPYKQAVETAPSYFNNLASGVDNRANITQGLKSSVSDVYNANRKTSAENYAPINNSNLRFDNSENNNLFPNYASATNQLLANRENMSNLFDKDSDLSASLRNEIDKAQGVISNSNTYGITLPEAVSRMQNLGQLQASANSQGRRYEGMLLGQLKDGLSTDVTNNLVSSGNSDLANQLQTANDYHKNNIVPFYQNNNIRKAVTSNYIPPKASLATALHDPNSQSILMQMPNKAQNASLYQLLTGGKGSSSGVSNMDASAIGNAYSKLPVDAKTAIAKYNPQADKYFENLPSYFQQNQAIEAAKQPLTQQLGQLPDALSQQMEKLSASGNKNIQGLQSQLEDLKQQRFGNTPEKGAGAEKAAKAAEGLGALAIGHFISPYAAAALPLGSLLGRTTAKALSNPELAQAYINNARLPVNQSVLTQALMRGLPAATIPYFNQQGGR